MEWSFVKEKKDFMNKIFFFSIHNRTLAVAIKWNRKRFLTNVLAYHHVVCLENIFFLNAI